MLLTSRPCFMTVILLLFTYNSCCLATASINPFQGKWVNDYGTVEISNCEDKTCKIEIFTANGAHMCNLTEKLTVLSDRAAIFKVKNDYVDNGKDLYPINIALSQHTISLSVPEKSLEAARGYCGMRAFFAGKYTNSTVPRIYKTSFNCNNARTQIDVAICQSPELAYADVVLSKLYFELKNKHISNFVNQQKLWIKERNTCSNFGNITQCLLEKYSDRIVSLQQNVISGSFKPEIRNRIIFYNNDYLFHFSKLSNSGADDIFQNPPLQRYLKSFLSKDAYDRVRRVLFNDIQFEEISDNSMIMIKGASPGLYTICEGALVLTKDNQLWLAYINIGKDSKSQLFVYYSQNTNPLSMPNPLRLWVYRLLSDMDNQEIVYKKILS